MKCGWRRAFGLDMEPEYAFAAGKPAKWLGIPTSACVAVSVHFANRSVQIMGSEGEERPGSGSQAASSSVPVARELAASRGVFLC